MASDDGISNLTKHKRRRLSLDDFDAAFGDLTPIPEFKGPRVPSNRQSLRRFLYELPKSGNSKSKAAEKVITDVLDEHNSPSHKTEKHLQTTPIQMYDDLK